MKAWKNNNRSVKVFFGAALAVHTLFVLVPLAEKKKPANAEQMTVQVRLSSPQPPIEQSPETAPFLEALRQPGNPILEELPAAPQAVQRQPVIEVVQPATDSTRRVLSSQFDYENSVYEPLFGVNSPIEEKPDFYVRQRSSLETVLNQPSLQLPFEDTRIYLVDSYDNGFMGGMEKFWDSVSVPFGFTTKNNTRVQCVWVLVIAGCGWGHESLFHRPARLREKPKRAGS
jgi:hypothetical protein